MMMLFVVILDMLLGIAAMSFIIGLPLYYVRYVRGEDKARKLAISVRNPGTTFAEMKHAFHHGGRVRFWQRFFRQRELNFWWTHCRADAAQTMADYAETGATVTERAEIASIMRIALLKAMREHERHDGEDTGVLVAALAAAAPVWGGEFLEQVASSRIQTQGRGKALEALARLRGRDALPFIMQFIDEPEMARHATMALVQLGRTTAVRPHVVDRLRQLISESQDDWTVSDAVRAMIAFGLSDDAVITANLGKLPVWTRFAVRVKAAHLDAPALIERLFSAGIIGEPHRKTIKASAVNRMRKALNAGDGFAALIPFLTRVRASWSFDGEWGGPPDYADLMRQLPKIWPQWPVTEIVLRMDAIDPDTCREVRLKIDGLPMHFAPKPMDDWVDMETIVESLNNTFAAARKPERFAVLLGDQFHVIVGFPEGLRDLARTLDLPLWSSSDVL